MKSHKFTAKYIKAYTKPNGKNINADCGSTHPQTLQAAVLINKADLGVALDGDGDRILMVDHTGSVVDGDEIIVMIARARQQEERQEQFEIHYLNALDYLMRFQDKNCFHQQSTTSKCPYLFCLAQLASN